MENAWEPLPDTYPVLPHKVTGCRWPIGDRPMLMCNADQYDVKNEYCLAHAKMAYTPRVTHAKANVR